MRCSSRRLRPCLTACAVCSIVIVSAARPAAAVEVVLVNDSAGEEPSSALIQAGFAEGEIAAAVFVPASNNPPIQFPFRVKRVRIYWRSQNGSTPARVEGAIMIWQNTTVTNSFPLDIVDPGELMLQCDAPCLIDNPSAINEFDFETTPECPPPVLTTGPRIAVGLRFTTDPFECQFTGEDLPRRTVACGFGHPELPSVVVDVGRTSFRNIIFAINACGTPAGWYTAEDVGISGDFIIRAVVESVNLSPPDVTGVDPTSAPHTGPVHLRIFGTNFIVGQTTAILTRSGDNPVGGTNLSVNGAGTEVEADFDITGRTTGAWDIMVTTPNGSDTLVGGFQITPAPPPTLTDFSPDTASNNLVLDATLTGTGFVTGGTSAVLSSGGTMIDATDVVVAGSTSLTCRFDLRGVPGGSYDCEVTTSAGSGLLLDALLVTKLPPPTVYGGDVFEAPNCPGALDITVFGESFQNGADAFLSRAAHADIPAVSVVFLDSFTLSAEFDLAGAAVGDWNLKVVNPDLQSAESVPENYFLTIDTCVPAVVSIAPNSANNHQTALAITDLAGQNFVPGAAVTLRRPGQPDIAAPDVVVSGDNQHITCTLDLFLVELGAWDVIVTNPGGGQDTLPGGFLVVAGPAPTVALVTPGNPDNCDVWTATINGSNYLNGAAARLVLGGEPDIVGFNVVRNSPSQLRADFDLTGVATTPGADKWDCVVTNPDGQSGTGVNRVNVVDCPVACLKADVNGDTRRDGDDIGPFVRVLITQSGMPEELCAADLTAPSGVDAGDVAPFVDCLVAEACP